MGRAPCCDKGNVKKGPWSPEEDAELKAYIEEHGTGGNWIALPQKMGLKRCGKSCRLRWLNYLRPNLRHGGFSEEEDRIIYTLYISIGSKWSIIAAQLPGRTDNDIKNYWNSRLKKRLLGKQRESSIKQERKEEPPMSASVLERMQLHMQLQTLHTPFSSFYNHPALWPKFHPISDLVAATSPVNPDLSNSMQEGFDCYAAMSTETSTSNLGSVVPAGLQGGMVYSESQCFEGRENHQYMNELDCFKELMVSEKESAEWWAESADSGFNLQSEMSYNLESC